MWFVNWNVKCSVMGDDNYYRVDSEDADNIVNRIGYIQPFGRSIRNIPFKQ